jgi:deoxyhypusine synthase
VWIYDDFTISSIYQKNENYLLKICKKYQDNKKNKKSFMLEPCIARAMSLVKGKANHPKRKSMILVAYERRVTFSHPINMLLLF